MSNTTLTKPFQEVQTRSGKSPHKSQTFKVTHRKLEMWNLVSGYVIGTKKHVFFIGYSNFWCVNLSSFLKKIMPRVIGIRWTYIPDILT